MAAAVAATARYKLVFFAPPAALTQCKKAVFAAGAGRFPGPDNSDNYTECCWTVIGTGQFRPGVTANPNVGSVGQLEQIDEARVEVLCLGEGVARKAVEELKKAHPFEEPAYEVYKIEDL